MSGTFQLFSRSTLSLECAKPVVVLQTRTSRRGGKLVGVTGGGAGGRDRYAFEMTYHGKKPCFQGGPFGQVG